MRVVQNSPLVFTGLSLLSVSQKRIVDLFPPIRLSAGIFGGLKILFTICDPGATSISTCAVIWVHVLLNKSQKSTRSVCIKKKSTTLNCATLSAKNVSGFVTVGPRS